MFVLPLIGLELGIILYPVGFSLWVSFHDVSLIKQTTEYVGFQQYAKAFTDTFFSRSILVSIRFIAEVTALMTFLSIGIALVLNERVRGFSILKVVVILPWALSEFAVAIAGRFFLDRNYGLLNSLLLKTGILKQPIYFLNAPNAVEWLAVFFAWNMTPIGAFFILSALQTVPEDLYKQARIDGSSAFMRFRAITFPFIRYAVLITTVLATIFAGSSVVVSFAMTGGGPGFASTPATLYDFRVFFNSQDFGYGAALSWWILIFVLIAAITYFWLLTRRPR